MLQKKAQRKKTRKHRGKLALRSAAGALFYEWKTARDTFNLIHAAQKKNDQALLNAALESYLIHARNIRDFYRTNGRNNDILAIDFLGRSLRVAMPYLRRNKKRLDRRIAHLSYSRTRMAHDWDIPRIMSEIEDSMNRFTKRLKLAHRSIAKDTFHAL